MRQLDFPLARIRVADDRYFAGGVTELVGAWPAMVKNLRQEEQQLQSTEHHVPMPAWKNESRVALAHLTNSLGTARRAYDALLTLGSASQGTCQTTARARR